MLCISSSPSATCKRCMFSRRVHCSNLTLLSFSTFNWFFRIWISLFVPTISAYWQRPWMFPFMFSISYHALLVDFFMSYSSSFLNNSISFLRWCFLCSIISFTAVKLVSMSLFLVLSWTKTSFRVTSFTTSMLFWCSAILTSFPDGFIYDASSEEDSELRVGLCVLLILQSSYYFVRWWTENDQRQYQFHHQCQKVCRTQSLLCATPWVIQI